MNCIKITKNIQFITALTSVESNISEHIANIFEEGELVKEATVRKFRTVQFEGDRQVERNLVHYNLDMKIISERN